MNPGCSVETCDDQELPHQLRGDQAHYQAPQQGTFASISNLLNLLVQKLKDLAVTFGIVTPGKNKPCTDAQLVDPAIPEAHRPYLNEFCPLDPLEEGATCDYVDLIANSERYTGYSGRAAHKVWEKVYNELCFHPEKDEKSFELTAETAREMCFEKRAFFRVISGMHASITVHITSNYLLEEGRPGKEALWGRNQEEFLRRFRFFKLTCLVSVIRFKKFFKSEITAGIECLMEQSKSEKKFKFVKHRLNKNVSAGKRVCY